MQALSPRQVVFVPPSQEGMQAVQVVFPRQATLTHSPGIVQAIQTFIPKQAVSIPHICQEEVLTLLPLSPTCIQAYPPGPH